MPAPTITALPTPPSTSDPTNFATQADAFIAALPTFVSEANALAAYYAATGLSNAATLLGNTWAAPGPIGEGTPGTGKFSTITITGGSLVSGASVLTISTAGGSRHITLTSDNTNPILNVTAGSLAITPAVTIAGVLTTANIVASAINSSGDMTVAAGSKSNVGGDYQGRSVQNSTNSVNIKDGTAPIGTVASSITLYSTAGELRVMDAGGTATLLSPHDKDGSWIYDSTCPTTGKRLRVDMEHLVKAVNAKFGWNFVHETDLVH